MTAFIVEAKRLNLSHPMSSFASDGSNSLAFKGTGPFDDEGLCISHCSSCRQFRNAVREALAAEAAEAAAKQAPLNAAFERGRLQGRIESITALITDLNNRHEGEVAELEDLRALYEEDLLNA